MKIAFVMPLFPKLSETFILNQVTGLLERGHHVDIFAERRSGEFPVHADVEKYKLLDCTHYYLDVPSNKLIRLLTGINLILKYFKKHSKIILRSLNIFRYGRPALSLSLLYKTAPFLENYDIIHCQFGTIGNWGAVLKELGIEAKLVTTFHGFDIRLGVEKGGHIYHNLFNKGDCFIAISDYNYDNLIKFGLDKNKIVCLPVGIDISSFSKHQSKNSGNTKTIVILTVARLVKEKGLQYGIKAVHKLLQQRPGLSLKYYIIGDGPLKEDLTNLTRKLMLSGVVHFHGSLKQKDIIEEMKQSNIFLFPSIAEALPVSLMEVQAVGLPVVATRVGSINQIVSDGKSGFLVPERDVDSLTDRLAYLIDHPERWSEMGCRGRSIVKKHYDINKLNDRLVEIYQRLLEES